MINSITRVAIADLMHRSGVRFGTSGVRGLVQDLSDELCYAYTLAFLQTAAEDVAEVVLGHDLRPSSPTIAMACAAAIQATGMKVIYAGALPTPALAHYASHRGAAAVVVTGSHIPFDRNGIKFYRASGEISKRDEEAITAATIALPTTILLPPLGDPDPGATLHYQNRYLHWLGEEALSGMRVAVYQHSSVARDLLVTLLQQLGATVIPLERTDTFVPIDTEAVSAEDIARGQRWAEEHDFHAIVSTDGDSDRPLIGDAQGHWLRGDMVGLLTAKFLQAKTIVCPISCNSVIERCGLFLRVERCRIGSPYVIAAMEALCDNPDLVPVVGFEANGGFLLGNDQLRHGRRLTALPTRDALLPILALLMLSRESQTPLAALAEGLPSRFSASDRITGVTPQQSQALLQTLRSDLTAAAAQLAPDSGEVIAVNELDGLRLTFNNGEIVHLRPSGNAPELRCYSEADQVARAQQICQAALQQIASMAAALQPTANP
ncbi:MAG: phosphomannomutase [Gammaproteobacteria bacterium]|nr:phosphomannomutase [Gammaproteobacteria bacterium]